MDNFSLTNKAYQPGLNYWIVNPQVALLKPFKPLYNLDNGSTVSSNYMWAVVFLEDNDEEINKLAPLTEEIALETIKESYFPEIDYLLPEFIVARKDYPEYCMSIAQRMLKIQEDQIKKYQEFIDNTELTLDTPDTEGKMRIIPGTIKQVAALNKTIAGLIKELKDLKELFEVEKKEARVFGGRKETLSEKGLI